MCKYIVMFIRFKVNQPKPILSYIYIDVIIHIKQTNFLLVFSSSLCFLTNLTKGKRKYKTARLTWYLSRPRQWNGTIHEKGQQEDTVQLNTINRSKQLMQRKQIVICLNMEDNAKSSIYPIYEFMNTILVQDIHFSNVQSWF